MSACQAILDPTKVISCLDLATSVLITCSRANPDHHTTQIGSHKQSEEVHNTYRLKPLSHQ